VSVLFEPLVAPLAVVIQGELVLKHAPDFRHAWRQPLKMVQIFGKTFPVPLDHQERQVVPTL
jgi:hypothetical protein